MADHAHTHSTITKKTYWTVFAILMVLLFLTVFVAYQHIDPTLAIIVAMTIAIVKAVLVVLYFMHVKEQSRLTWVFVVAGFFWLLLLIGITLTDYYSRDWEIGGYTNEIDEFSSPYGLPAEMLQEQEKRRLGNDPAAGEVHGKETQEEAGEPVKP